MEKINHINAELTRRCNLRCNYCFNDSGKPMKYELSLENWKDIFRTGKNCGAGSILITGGEFMMRNDSLKILNFAIDSGLKTSILSNGYNINLIEENVLKKLQKAQISLDSYNPLIHDAKRGRGSWENAMKSISYLRKNNVPVEISSTISPTDIPEIKGLAKLALSTNSKLLLRPLQKLGRNKDGDYLSLENLKNIKKKYGSLFVEDIERYVPISKEHDLENLKQGIITLLPDGNLRGINKNFYNLCNVTVA